MYEFLHLCEGMKPYNMDLAWVKARDRDYASNEYWIKIYQMGEKDLAIRNIIWNNKGVLASILYRFKVIDTWIDGYEAFSLLLLAIDKALNSFNADKGAKFITYFNTVYRNEVFMEIRKIKRHSHCDHLERPIATLIDDYKIITLGDTIKDYHSLNSINESLEYSTTLIAIDNLIKRVNPCQQTILKLAMEGKKQKEIGEAIGTSQSHVSRVLKKLKVEYEKERRKLE